MSNIQASNDIVDPIKRPEKTKQQRKVPIKEILHNWPRAGGRNPVKFRKTANSPNRSSWSRLH